jgi:hypothetical protein
MNISAGSREETFSEAIPFFSFKTDKQRYHESKRGCIASLRSRRVAADRAYRKTLL